MFLNNRRTPDTRRQCNTSRHHVASFACHRDTIQCETFNRVFARRVPECQRLVSTACLRRRRTTLHSGRQRCHNLQPGLLRSWPWRASAVRAVDGCLECCSLVAHDHPTKPQLFTTSISPGQLKSLTRAHDESHTPTCMSPTSFLMKRNKMRIMHERTKKMPSKPTPEDREELYRGGGRRRFEA